MCVCVCVCVCISEVTRIVHVRLQGTVFFKRVLWRTGFEMIMVFWGCTSDSNIQCRPVDAYSHRPYHFSELSFAGPGTTTLSMLTLIVSKLWLLSSSWRLGCSLWDGTPHLSQGCQISDTSAPQQRSMREEKTKKFKNHRNYLVCPLGGTPSSKASIGPHAATSWPLRAMSTAMVATA